MINLLPIPKTFHLFNLTLPIWGMIFILAIIIPTRTFGHCWRKNEFSMDLAWPAILHFAFWTFLGFHLFNFIFVSQDFSQLLSIRGNDSAGFILGVIAYSIYLKKNNLSIPIGLDIIGMTLLAMATLMRFSDMLIGDKVGLPANLPWSIMHNDIATHPVGIYYFISTLIILIIILATKRYFAKPGNLFFTSIILIGISRFFIDIFRVFPPHDYLNLSVHQIAWAAYAIVAFILLKYRPSPFYTEKVWKLE
ncbi:prolipoprotein diacylglyceryl transferase [Candidatus Woesearchaeota archaeon]|nr:prolipoprotein diacylglyceryl transferase [Candidatus Woesearchaeota archaeon]